MFSKTRSTQRVLSTMFALILLLLWMKQVCAQTIGVDPITLDFGSPVIGQSVTKTLTVRNTGTAALFVIFERGSPPPPSAWTPRWGRIQDTAK